MTTIVDGAGLTAHMPGPPGTLLFENGLVRIWELVLGPDEYCLWHNHPYDHLLVLENGAELESLDANGQKMTLEFDDHQAFFVPKGNVTEVVRNVSKDRTLRELIIDLKTP